MQIKTVALSATLLSLALGAAFALHSNEQEREISNYQGTYTCSPEAIYDPSSIEEVQDIVQDALLRGKTVMTGNRKFASQIDAACAGDDQVQITLKNMNKIISFDANAKQVTVEAGMRFNDLNDFLRQQGYAIGNGAFESGAIGIAAAVYNATGETCGAISVACPEHILNEEKKAEIIQLVLEAARQISWHQGAPHNVISQLDSRIADA